MSKNWAIEQLEFYHKGILGPDCMKNVVLVSSFWPKQSDVEGHASACKREEELLTDELFWKPLIQSGAQSRRFTGTSESALEIISLAQGNTPVSLRIQRELVDRSLTLKKTEAGKRVEGDRNKMGKRYNKSLKDLQKTMKHQGTSRADLEEEESKLKQALMWLEKDLAILNGRWWSELTIRVLYAFELAVKIVREEMER